MSDLNRGLLPVQASQTEVAGIVIIVVIAQGAAGEHVGELLPVGGDAQLVGSSQAHQVAGDDGQGAVLRPDGGAAEDQQPEYQSCHAIAIMMVQQRLKVRNVWEYLI
jgi:hypothetical protein